MQYNEYMHTVQNMNFKRLFAIKKKSYQNVLKNINFLSQKDLKLKKFD